MTLLPLNTAMPQSGACFTLAHMYLSIRMLYSYTMYVYASQHQRPYACARAHTHTQLLVTYTPRLEAPWSATAPRPSPPAAGTGASSSEAPALDQAPSLPALEEAPSSRTSHEPPPSTWDAPSPRRHAPNVPWEPPSQPPPFREPPSSRWDALSGRRDGRSEASERREASGQSRAARDTSSASPGRQAAVPAPTPQEQSPSFHAAPHFLDPVAQQAEVCVFCACGYRRVSAWATFACAAAVCCICDLPSLRPPHLHHPVRPTYLSHPVRPPPLHHVRICL
jgi:hypothetical protein